MSHTTWQRVRIRRLRRSSLLARAPAGRLVQVVSRLCGVHAQVQISAELQLAARVTGITRDDVRSALWKQRTLVKAWTLRGTLHLHPADELPLWLAARRATAGTPRDRDELPEWRDPSGVLHPPIGADDVEAIRTAVWDALDGRCLLREELAEEVVRRVGPAPRERLRSGFAFFLGDLCQGPTSGAKITLARPDQWITGWRELDPAEALREACRRYLRTYGPSRPADFREWIGGRGFAPESARAVFGSLADELDDVAINARHALALRGDTRFPDADAPTRLLPEYDVYVMGFRERDHLVPDAVSRLMTSSERRYEGPAGVRFLLLDGELGGLWERTQRARRVEIRVRPARRLNRAQRRAIEAEVQSIGDFLGQPALTVIE